MDRRNVLITGLPRSGTTLTCELLNELEDTIALDEPMHREIFTAQQSRRSSLPQRAKARLLHHHTATPKAEPLTADEVCNNIAAFTLSMRHSLLTRGVGISKQVEGRVRGSKVADTTQASGLRVRLASRTEVRFDKALSSDFLLAIKHNSAFAGVLDVLAARMRVYAVVRNPLSIIASWQTVPFAVQRGHATLAELFHAPLANDIARIEDRIDRQFHLLGWFFSRFLECLPEAAILRYEDVIATGGTALEKIAPQAAGLKRPLRSRNAASVYSTDALKGLGTRLLDTDGPYWHLYSRNDVAQLMRSSS